MADFKIIGRSVPRFDAPAKVAGETKYPLKKMLSFAIEGITSFSVKPLTFITWLGILIMAISALTMIINAIAGGGLSLVASANPDGLEWSIQKITGRAELSTSGPAYTIASWIQSKTALMPDYSTGAASPAASTSSAGLIGGAIVLALAAGTAFVLSRAKKKRNDSNPEAK